jgi:hypothetical protein
MARKVTTTAAMKHVDCPYCRSSGECHDGTGTHAQLRAAADREHAKQAAAARTALPGRCVCGRHVTLLTRPWRWVDPTTGEPCKHPKGDR